MIRLRDALCGLGMAVPFYPRIARMLQSNSASLLLSQMWFWADSEGDEDGWFTKTREEIEAAVGLSRRSQESARTVLRSHDLLIEKREGNPARLHFRLDFDQLESIWMVHTKMTQRRERGPSRDETGHLVGTKAPNKPVRSDTAKMGGSVPTNNSSKKELNTEEGAAPGQLVMTPEGKAPWDPKHQEPSWSESLTFDQIMQGRADAIPKKQLLQCPKGVMTPLIKRWAEMWGKSTNRVFVTGDRQRSWRACIKAGMKPSEFARAITGMRFDEWKDRYKHCEWHAILKSPEKWLKLYDANKGRDPLSLNGKKTKVVSGVIVPHDYDWNGSDQFMLDQGYKFDLEAGQWKRR